MLRYPTVLSQVVALACACVVVAVVASVAATVFMPPPTLRPMTIETAASAIRSSADTAGGRLDVSRKDAPPAFVSSPPALPAGLIADGLAFALEVPRDRVHVAVVGEAPAGTGVEEDHPGRIAVIETPRGIGRYREEDGDVPHLPEVLATTPISFPAFQAAVEGEDGRWTVVSPREPLLSLWRLRFVGALVFAAALILPLAVWIASRLTTPLRELAAAAHGFDAASEPRPISLSGSAEVRALAKAFNAMHEKIASHVHQRTQMLTAIAHDLRTPLTSLRIRAEYVEGEARESILRDVDRMQEMVDGVLCYADQIRDSDFKPIRFGDLLRAEVRRYREMGKPVRIVECEDVDVRGRESELVRLIQNLLNNALEFGRTADVSLRSEQGSAVFEVADAGPGIPEEALTRVFEPFYRLEPSRSRSTGGSGLGLAIALNVAKSHHGDLALANKQGGGLRATVSLPSLSVASSDQPPSSNSEESVSR